MRYVLEITCDNAAFEPEGDEPDRISGIEISRILREQAERWDGWNLQVGHEQALRDINGNLVGTAKLVK
jgi:hypothetical protein